MTSRFTVPPELSIQSITRELEKAGLAQMGQGVDPDDVVGLLLLGPELIRLFSGQPGALADGETLIGAPELLFGFFPGDGTYEPLPAGEMTFDLEGRTVTGPLSGLDLQVAADVLDNARSLIVIPDSLVKVELEPDSGQIPIAGGVFVGNARSVTKVLITADRPYNLLMGFSTSQLSPQMISASRFQIRTSTTTLTKVAAAAVADPLVDVPVVPQFGTKTLDQATFGDAIIPTLGWGLKGWVVRNTGANAAEVQLQGRMDPDGAFIPVVDGTLTGARETIAAGDDLIMATGLPWIDLRLQAAVAAAVAATLVTTIEVSYNGVQPQTR